MTAALAARPGAAGAAVPGPGGGGTVLELAAVTNEVSAGPYLTFCASTSRPQDSQNGSRPCGCCQPGC
jgi:hypothetical protein